MSKYGFDEIAFSYDEVFTNTGLAVMQRKVVFNHLDKIIAERNILNVLELNCGTGEDAIYFRKKGCHVVATDISLSMLNVARSKAAKHNVDGIRFLPLDLRHIDQLEKFKKFDLIFSNFGGLNCLNKQEIENAIKAMKNYLSETGIVVLVLMPDKCILERIYGLIKSNRDLMRRRTRSPQKVKINDCEILTWYYAPQIIENVIVRCDYERTSCFPIGFIPSYFSAKVEKRRLIFRLVRLVDGLATKFGILAAYSDHYLISFSRGKGNN